MTSTGSDISLAGLAELIRISEEARESFQTMAKAVDEARERCGEAGARVADHVLAGVEVPASLIREYKTAREIFNSTAKAVHEKYRRYSEISDQLLKELKKPSAAATAEGDRGLDVAKIRIADEQGMFVIRFGLDSKRDSRPHEEPERTVLSVDIEPEGFTIADLGNDSVQHIRIEGRTFVGNDLTAVNELRQENSLSVDGAPDGAGVGTSDSTERVQTPDSPETKEPSAAATAEGNETKNHTAK